MQHVARSGTGSAKGNITYEEETDFASKRQVTEEGYFGIVAATSRNRDWIHMDLLNTMVYRLKIGHRCSAIIIVCNKFYATKLSTKRNGTSSWCTIEFLRQKPVGACDCVISSHSGEKILSDVLMTNHNNSADEDLIYFGPETWEMRTLIVKGDKTIMDQGSSTYATTNY